MPRDPRGGAVSEQRQYPEKAQRESMLRGAYEWFQEQTDYQPRLYAEQVVSMSAPLDTDRGTEPGAEAEVAAATEQQKVQALYRFLSLVDEGYISAKLDTSYKGGPPFVSAQVRGLTAKGLIEIGKLPDPQGHLLAGLEAALREVQQDPTLGPEEKEEKLNAGREALAFIRGLAIEVSARVLMGG